MCLPSCKHIFKPKRQQQSSPESGPRQISRFSADSNAHSFDTVDSDSFPRRESPPSPSPSRQTSSNFSNGPAGQATQISPQAEASSSRVESFSTYRPRATPLGESPDKGSIRAQRQRPHQTEPRDRPSTVSIVPNEDDDDVNEGASQHRSTSGGLGRARSLNGEDPAGTQNTAQDHANWTAPEQASTERPVLHGDQLTLPSIRHLSGRSALSSPPLQHIVCSDDG